MVTRGRQGPSRLKYLNREVEYRDGKEVREGNLKRQWKKGGGKVGVGGGELQSLRGRGSIFKGCSHCVIYDCDLFLLDLLLLSVE